MALWDNADYSNPWGDTNPWDTSTGNAYSGPVTGFTPAMAQDASSMGNPWGDTSGWDASSGGGSGLGGILNKISGALNTLGGGSGLGSGKQQAAQVSPPANRLPGYSQMQSAQYHPGSAASGLSNDLSTLAALIKTKGLLGL
jgi:hypothetical protein